MLTLVPVNAFDSAGISFEDNPHEYEVNGDIVDDDPVIEGGGGNTQHLFMSIEAAKVNSILTSNVGRKSFTLKKLPVAAKKIVCKGNLDHSLADEWGMIGNLEGRVKFGVCYYGYNGQTGQYEYITVHEKSFTYNQLGTTISSSFLISNVLESDKTYYSFVKNEYPAGYITGWLNLYYDTNG